MGKKLINIESIKLENENFLHYLYENTDSEVRFFLQNISRVADIYIFSGVIRNFFINPKFKIRDLDLVFKTDNITAVRNIVNLFNFSLNSFGGFKIKINNLSIDFWNIEDTWAFNKKSVFTVLHKELVLPESSFFNFSSIVFDLKQKEFIVSESFVDFLKRKEIDLVLEENPYPVLCIVNTIYYSNTYQLKISKRLRRYFISNFKNYHPNDFEQAQLKHFKQVIYPYGMLNTYYKIFSEQLCVNV